MSAVQLADAHGVLAAKIRSQAGELTRTLEAVQAARAYGALVERRLLQGAPEHALPVTEAHLSAPFPWPTLRAPRDDGGEARRAAEAAVRAAASACIRRVMERRQPWPRRRLSTFFFFSPLYSNYLPISCSSPTRAPS